MLNTDESMLYILHIRLNNIRTYYYLRRKHKKTIAIHKASFLPKLKH